MTNRIGLVALCGMAVLVSLTGCAKKVWVMAAPDRDLHEYGTVGLVTFSGTDPALSDLATSQFQESVLAGQPGVGVIEIAPDQLGAPDTDAAAIRSLARQHGVDAVFTGDLAISRVMPRFDVSMSIVDVRGSAEQQVSLSTRLIETDGATVWSRSSGGTITLGRASMDSLGRGGISVGDPTEAQTHLIHDLVSDVTADFLPRYYRTRPENVPAHYVLVYMDGDPVYAPPERLSTAE